MRTTDHEGPEGTSVKEVVEHIKEHLDKAVEYFPLQIEECLDELTLAWKEVDKCGASVHDAGVEIGAIEDRGSPKNAVEQALKALGIDSGHVQQVVEGNGILGALVGVNRDDARRIMEAASDGSGRSIGLLGAVAAGSSPDRNGEVPGIYEPYWDLLY